MANAVLEQEIARIQAARARENERFTRNSVRKTEERAPATESVQANRRILFDGITYKNGQVFTAEQKQAEALAPVKEVQVKEVRIPSAAERVSQYTAVKSEAPAGRRVLFEGITYKNGELYGVAQKQESAPVAEAVAIAAPVAAPVMAPEGEADDAIPTRRTMDTLRRAEEERVSAARKESVSYALSSKTKLIIAAVALAIVLVIAIICVNTSVINSLNADIAQLQETSQALASQAAEIEQNIAEVTAWENVMEFAKQLGMIIPG